jgi:hypothetical protein
VGFRHFDAGVFQQRRKVAHGLLFAVHQKRSLRVSRLSVPGKEFGLVGVGGEPVDRVNSRLHRDLLTEEVDMRGAVDDPAGKGAVGGIADKDNAWSAPWNDSFMLTSLVVWRVTPDEPVFINFFCHP